MRKKVPWKSRGKKREKGWVWVTKRKEGGQEGEELGVDPSQRHMTPMGKGQLRRKNDAWFDYYHLEIV